MIEWIILVWTVANPLTGFHGNVVENKLGKRPPQVFITSTTADFTAKWETLSKDEKENSQIFLGKKAVAQIVLNPTPGIVGENVDGRCNSIQANNDVRCALDYAHAGRHQLHKNTDVHQCSVDW